MALTRWVCESVVAVFIILGGSVCCNGEIPYLTLAYRAQLKPGNKKGWHWDAIQIITKEGTTERGGVLATVYSRGGLPLNYHGRWRA